MKKILIHILIVAFSGALLCAPVLALDDDEFNGYSADTLVIKVGYFGSPHYEKAVFSLEELWAMDIVYADYTFIDNMPSVVINHVAGVRLSDIVTAAGIDIGSVQTFYFWTRDKTSDFYTSYSKSELIDTPRYCYYSLPDNFDDEGEGANEFADSNAVRVDTLISLEDDWNRVIAGASFGSDYQNLNTNTRFRLVFGQTNTWEHTASRSAKWIHEIVVELGGAPVLTLDASVLEGEVGSVLRTEASAFADPVFLENEPVLWTSSDESVASVDSSGNITVLGEGEAVITATFAGVSASLIVNGSAAEVSESGGENAEGDPVEGGADMAIADEPVSSELSNDPSQPPQELSPSDDLGNFTQLNPPEVISENMQGGVQNWRVFEMSEAAAALPSIEADNRLSGFAAGAAVALFSISGTFYAGKFYFDVRRTPDVYKPKPH